MYKLEKKYYKKAFFTALIMALVMYLPFVIIDRGYFIFYGDYNAQQIPFFKMCVQAVHNGTIGWDWHTDLGANFFGSYTYYTLGSPFFWIMTLFPASVSQYLMMPLLCVKFGLFSLFAFMYIRRFVAKPQTALIGGILYAFSSFNLYNIFFQFQDAYIWFPLLLIGLEEAVINKRRGLFALAVAINALANYFFFVQECVFLVIYFLCRFAMDKRFSVKVRDFFGLAFESVLGVVMAGVLFIPSIYQVLDVPRSHSMLSDWNFLFFSNEQRYGLLLENTFFPPEVAARNSMFTEANAKWSSVALYLPLFSMAGVIAFIKDKKGHWARVLIAICIVMAFVPGLNAAFTLLNSNYYTRWFYMPELIMCLATVYVLENEELDMKSGCKSCAVVVVLMSVLALLSPFTQKTKNSAGEEITNIIPRFQNNMSPAVWVQIAIAAAMLVVLYILMRFRPRFTWNEFMKRATAVTIVCSLGLGYYFVGYGRAIGPKVGRYNMMVDAKFSIDDPDFYRIEGINETNNVNMFWGMSSLKSFTSIIPGSTFELYDLLGITRTVNSAPDHNRYAFRAFSRVKYIMIPNDMSKSSRESALKDLAIYEYMETQGNYDIYKTEYALPMGFAYDDYLLQEDVKDNRKVDNLIVRAAVLTEEQSKKYADILNPLDPTDTGIITLERFKSDAGNRIAEGVQQFSINRNGFTAVSDYDSEKLVVFSVPYCKGWSATVNGQPVEVDKINAGLCGIRVPEGRCDISFTYETPGLKIGIIMTVGGIVIFAAYIWFFVYRKRQRGNRYAHLYELTQVEGIKAHNSYIGQISEQIYTCPERDENSSADQEMQFPEIEENFMLDKRVDYSRKSPKERSSHITEDDEAYRVMEELDMKKQVDEENSGEEN
ncbi:MAG: YfhO family protein [Ruminococcaceae bacterium]|nr:YfhO family protein [Oscillospiraceae bacterium]